MDKKVLKRLNSNLAASAQPEVRETALKELQKLLVQEKKWVEDPDKDLKMIWQGLFFDFWHSDKPVYQKETAEKITQLLTDLGTIDVERQKQWFEAFIYSFNIHWDKVDNYRIDKFLMFLRYQFNHVLQFIKKQEYQADTLEWFKLVIQRLFMEETIISKGIPLQICDVFLQELNKVDALAISYHNLASILEPFLYAVANCRNKILIQRIIDKIFIPILENNVTIKEESDSESKEDEDEVPNYDHRKGKWIDGGKLPPKTVKELNKMNEQQFHFPNFNILLYSQEHLFKYASAKDTREENRDVLYKLYDKALKLEPLPEPELTFSQRMLINRAKQFITLRMHKRMRVNVQKRNKKLMHKLGNLISHQIVTRATALQLENLNEIAAAEAKQEDVKEQIAPATNGHQEKKQINGQQIINGNSSNTQVVVSAPIPAPVQSQDVIMNIHSVSNNTRKKNKKRARQIADIEDSNRKKVKFDLNQVQTREFFSHGKVATMKLPESNLLKSPTKSLIKTYQQQKKQKQQQF